MKLTSIEVPPWKQIEFPATFESARQAEKQILEASSAMGFGAADLFDIRMALHEALVNAVKHGSHLDTAKRVHIGYRMDAARLEVVIRDEGKGFDPGAIPDPTADENLAFPSGRGILLMRASMDWVEFNPAGNAVTLRKSKRPASS